MIVEQNVLKLNLFLCGFSFIKDQFLNEFKIIEFERSIIIFRQLSYLFFYLNLFVGLIKTCYFFIAFFFFGFSFF